MNRAGERLYNGLIKENPTLVLMLGMCPTLAVTTSAINGFGMGAATLAVLALSNLIISLLRHVIPKRVRIPAFIVIIASFVTLVQLLLQAYLNSLNKALGVYIPLIVVNCIILGRAESYAYSNPPVAALFDGIGMGLGFTAALTCIGALREFLGAGELFGQRVLPASFEPVGIFIQAPGAFFVLAALTALQNFVKDKRKKAGKSYEKIGSGCTEDCMNCSDQGCKKRFYDTSVEEGQTEKEADSRIVSEPVSGPRGQAERESEGQIAFEPADGPKEQAERESEGQIAFEPVDGPEEQAERESEGQIAFEPVDGPKEQAEGEAEDQIAFEPLDAKEKVDEPKEKVDEPKEKVDEPEEKVDEPEEKEEPEEESADEEEDALEEEEPEEASGEEAAEEKKNSLAAVKSAAKPAAGKNGSGSRRKSGKKHGKKGRKGGR